LELAIVAIDGHEKTGLKVRWRVDGRIEKEGQADDLASVFTPKRVGPVLIRAEAVDAMGDTRTAELTILVVAQVGATAIPGLAARIKKAEFAQTTVSAILLGLIGSVIFRGVFYGTLQDLLSAFLWGFTTDVGLAKVRELGAPLVSRADVPAAKA
jgi:hypothetical protein